MQFSPDEVNQARDSLYQNIIDYFAARKDVVALYIQGSVAENTADEFSDLDFRVVVEPKSYQIYVAERFEAPKQWGDWLYNEWASRPWVCVSHFKPFNKIDLLYFKPEQIQPSPWFQLPTKVILDSNSLIESVIKASSPQEFDLLTTEEVERLISKGLAYGEEVYRRAMRGELFYAQSQLDNLRSVIIQFDDYLHQDFVSSGFGSSSHFERRGSVELVEILKLSYPLLEQRSIIKALNVLLQHYQIQVTQLHQQLYLERSQKTDSGWISTIQALCHNVTIS